MHFPQSLCHQGLQEKNMKTIRVAVFDDNLFFRESVNILLEGRMDLILAGAFQDANNVLNDVHSARPDVVLMDIDMPTTNGISALKKIKKEFPELPVMMLTDFDDDDKVIDSICSGANGYTLKTSTSEKIIEGIYDVYNGHSSLSPPIAKKVLRLFSEKFSSPVDIINFSLSPREKEVLQELVDGNSYKMIADKLGITYDTVRAHIKQIYRKLQVSSISAAVSKALRQRIIQA